MLSALLALCEGIHRWSMNSPHKWLVMRNFPLLLAFKQCIEQIVELPAIWDVVTPMWHLRNVSSLWNGEWHNNVIKWKRFPPYWPFVRGIHRLPLNSPHKGQWRGALMVSLICAWINGWVSNQDAGVLRRNRGHYDVTVMFRNDKTGSCLFLSGCVLRSPSQATLEFLGGGDSWPGGVSTCGITESKMWSFWRNFSRWLHWKM